jgi:hypothetical protein
LLDYGPLPAKIATDVAMQPVTAGKAVGNAIADPTLANVTDAGLQTSMAAFRPMAGLKVLGAGFGVAAARDMGLLPVGDANATGDGLSDAQRRRLQELQGKRSLSRAEREEQNSYLGIQAEAAKAAATRDAEIAKARGLAEVQAAADAERARAEDAAKQAEAKRQSDSRAVATAERARDEELARANRFDQTEVGKLYNKLGVMAPAAAAMGMGAITGRAAAAAGRNSLKWELGAPAATGAGTGAVVMQYPLAHDAMLTPSENPDRRAYEAYARELPSDHPRKQEWQDYARGLPEKNPTREAASRDLFDPWQMTKRIGMGALEGGITGAGGSEAARLIAGAPRSALQFSGAAKGIPAEGKAMQDARISAARAKAAQAEQSALSSEAGLRRARIVDSEAQAVEREAQRRTGGRRDDPVQTEQPVRPQPASEGVANSQSTSLVPVDSQGGSMPPATRDVVNKLLMPQGVKGNANWEPYSEAARTSLLSRIESGGTLQKSTGKGNATSITAKQIADDIGDGAPSPKVVQNSMARLRSIMTENGIDPNTVTRKQAEELLARLDPKLFAVPLAAGAVGATSMADAEPEMTPEERARLILARQMAGSPTY